MVINDFYQDCNYIKGTMNMKEEWIGLMILDKNT